jgi:2-keto-4-pentenoate hydratase/2-oxohepta-3-ene-1,7-dioic acid hydratase in catechol pathway
VKLISFEKDGRQSAGVLVPGGIVDLEQDMLAVLDAGEKGLEAARKASARKPALMEGDVRWLAPVPQPRALRDFFAFEDHAKAGAARRKEALAPEWYEQPVYYKGNHREIYGPGDTVPWPSYTRKLDFEFEIACVVGRKGRDLDPKEAGAHIAGYTIYNDFSARDIQKNEMVCRMGPAKAKDFANAFGPYLLTADELPEPEKLKMTLKINGEVWSEGDSSGRWWSFPIMLSHVSQEEWVYPGDILGSGTYHKGCGLDLDRWIKPGDVIELSVDKLGTLKNVVGAPRAQKHLVYGTHRQTRQPA